MAFNSANPKMGFQATDEDSLISLKMGFNNPKDGGLTAKPKLGFKVTGPSISVWWDYENCEVFRSADAISIANNIVAGLTKLRLSGPLTLSAYGDMGKIPPEVSEALHRTGITMIHVPPGRNSTDMRMILDMCLWAVEHPPPATYMLISGDKDFSTCLHRLRNLGYNILLAAFQTNCSSHLVSAAHHFLPWTDICLGQMSEVNGGAPTSTVNYSSPTATKDDAHQKSLKFGSQEPTKKWILKSPQDQKET